ncbi:MAG TPA: DUF2283 domain-containing protein [Candidatus Rubrimentiphilum sp.]|nr:DUF2283 domain-containing protein [Candidatus Rubrimentiphilum sp.]
MRPVIDVERSTDRGVVCLYLRYSYGNVVPPTKSLDAEGSVNVDYDAKGEIVGIEIIDVDDESVALTTQFANEHGLGLAGAFGRAA